MRSSPVVGVVLVVAGLAALALGDQDLLGWALLLLGVGELAVVLVRRRSARRRSAVASDAVPRRP